MKKQAINLLIIMLTCFVAINTAWAKKSGELKIIEKSSKKVPVWVGSVQTEYIVTSAIANDIETAKNKCIDNVKQEIIRSVAENVKVTSESTINQQSVSDGIVHFLDEYKSSYQTQAAPVPFMKGVSISKVEEYYWEKRQNKSTGKVDYLYAIKYPFPRVELKAMVHEFEKRDAAMYGRYKNFAEQYNNITSLEMIDKATAELPMLLSYFFDDVRRNEVRNLLDRYNKLYNQITFHTISNKTGEYKFSLMIGEKPIATSQRILPTSDCAAHFNTTFNGTETIVTYDYSGCKKGVLNTINVAMQLGQKKVNHTISFEVGKYKVAVWPEQTIYLSAGTKEEKSISDIDIRIYLKSELKKPYIVKSIMLDVPRLSKPLFIDDLNMSISAKNETVQIKWHDTCELEDLNNTISSSMLKGQMEIEVPEEGISERISFALPFKANW